MSTDLTAYGDRSDVKELGERIKRFLPGGSKMSAEDALGFAQIAIAQGLNPFAHEIWFIPGVGTVTGIEGYRKMAKRQAHYNAQCRKMTPEEDTAHDITANDIGAVCELYRPDVILQAVEVNKAAGSIVIPIAPVVGIGIRRGNEKRLPKGRSGLWVAEKRAEADALRKAFDLSVGYADNGEMIEPIKVKPPAIPAAEWSIIDEGESIEGNGFAEEPKPEIESDNGPRPYDPAQVRLRLRNNGGWVKGEAEDFSDAHRPPDDEQEPPDDRLVQRIAAMMGKALTRPEGGETDLERHLVLSWVFGVESTSLLTAKEADATARWLEAPAGEDGKPAWIPSGAASEECRLVLHQAMKDRGQQELDMGETE